MSNQFGCVTNVSAWRNADDDDRLVAGFNKLPVVPGEQPSHHRLRCRTPQTPQTREIQGNIYNKEIRTALYLGDAPRASRRSRLSRQSHFHVSSSVRPAFEHLLGFPISDVMAQRSSAKVVYPKYRIMEQKRTAHSRTDPGLSIELENRPTSSWQRS